MGKIAVEHIGAVTTVGEQQGYPAKADTGGQNQKEVPGPEKSGLFFVQPCTRGLKQPKRSHRSSFPK
jgi:hypothetical protein